MQKFITLVYLAALLGLSACSTLNADIVGSRLESPEVMGREGKRGEWQVSIPQGHRLQITSDASYRPPDLSRPKIDGGAWAGGAMNYGALEKLDLGIKTVSGASPWMLFAKLQILGNNANNAKQGNFSLSVTAAAGYGSTNKSGAQNGIFGPGGYDWKATVKTTATDFSLIAGYRVVDQVLLYGGGFYGRHWIASTIEHSRSDDGTSPAATYEIGYSGEQLGANLGLRLEFGQAPAFIVIEESYSDLKLTSTLKDWKYLTGVSIGARF